MQLPMKDVLIPQATFEPSQKLVNTLLNSKELEDYLRYLGITNTEYDSPTFCLNGEQYLRSFAFLKEHEAIKRITLPEWLASFSSITIGLGTLAAMSADSLSDALKVMVKYGPLYMPATKISFLEKGLFTKIWFEFTADFADMNQFQMEMIIGGISTITDELINKPMIQEVHFCHDNTTFEVSGLDQEDYNKLFSCPVLFNSTFNGILVKTADLRSPLPNANKATHQQTTSLLENELELHARPKTLISKARVILEASAEKGKQLSLDELADQMNFTPRTLSRRLLKEGTTFKHLANDVRFSLVISQLQHSDKPLKQIAIDAGFNNGEAFSRAFKSQFGTPPSEWREKRKTHS
ncbi:hypothetical protein A9Q99_01405 [Gammaproteobacteria bacterium 45_16_T64]|nr:hypothetical protein A9Q99_01405 [Gammaproteobacteria bacterium 45_16_T64]